MRFDVALFSLRLFPSRSQAAEAIESGAVLLNGMPAKPSRVVKAGDRVTFTNPSHARTIEIVELPAKSLSKDAARALVREISE